MQEMIIYHIRVEEYCYHVQGELFRILLNLALSSSPFELLDHLKESRSLILALSNSFLVSVWSFLICLGLLGKVGRTWLSKLGSNTNFLLLEAV